MKTDRRRTKVENKIVTGLINALLMGIAWWAIIVFLVIKVSG